MAGKIKQIQRNQNNRNFRECIVVIYEGKDNKTEEYYFNDYNKESNKFSISVVKANTTDPVQMVDNLWQYVKEKGLNEFKEYKAYCVFDTDLNPDKQQRIDEAIQLAKKKKNRTNYFDTMLWDLVQGTFFLYQKTLQ